LVPIYEKNKPRDCSFRFYLKFDPAASAFSVGFDAVVEISLDLGTIFEIGRIRLARSNSVDEALVI
jgi:hypothetical protein